VNNELEIIWKEATVLISKMTFL